MLTRWMKIYLLSLISIYPTVLFAKELGEADVLALVEASQILPLDKIIPRISHLKGGRLLELHLLQEDNGALIYEFEIIRPDGQVIEIEVDALTAQIVHEEFEE